MNKDQLARDIADRNGIPVNQARAELDRVTDAIVRNVVAGEKVALTGAFIIEQVTKAERDARNPQTGDRVIVPARPGVRVTVARNFIDLVRGDRALPETGNAAWKAPKGTFTKAK